MERVVSLFYSNFQDYRSIFFLFNSISLITSNDIHNITNQIDLKLIQYRDKVVIISDKVRIKTQ